MWGLRFFWLIDWKPMVPYNWNFTLGLQGSSNSPPTMRREFWRLAGRVPGTELPTTTTCRPSADEARQPLAKKNFFSIPKKIKNFRISTFRVTFLNSCAASPVILFCTHGGERAKSLGCRGLFEIWGDMTNEPKCLMIQTNIFKKDFVWGTDRKSG